MTAAEAQMEALAYWQEHHGIGVLLDAIYKAAESGEFFLQLRREKFEAHTEGKVSSGIAYLRNLGYFARREHAADGEKVVVIAWGNIKGGRNDR